MNFASTAPQRGGLASLVFVISMFLSGDDLAQVTVASAQDSARDSGSSKDLRVMEIDLKDAVQFNWGFQAALQGAGTPNQAGIGAFLPVSIGDNSVFFLDVLANANFEDRNGDSSIINTDVAGVTISTSSRLGYRWLNNDRSRMFGVNAGYDTRPMDTGSADQDLNLLGTGESAFFKQAAVGLEAVSDRWNFNTYALLPIGDSEQRINRFYQAGAVKTYGFDLGYSMTPVLKTTLGYYYQDGDLSEALGSGIRGQFEYAITKGLTIGALVSYDDNFETRVSGDLKYRFGSNSPESQSERNAIFTAPISALSATLKNRDIRVHDGSSCVSMSKCNNAGNANHSGKTCCDNGFPVGSCEASTSSSCEDDCTVEGGSVQSCSNQCTTTSCVAY